jgi:hypothetical protein
MDEKERKKEQFRFSLFDIISTPLHKAVLGGHLEAMQFLLSNGAKINAQDIYGMHRSKRFFYFPFVFFVSFSLFFSLFFFKAILHFTSLQPLPTTNVVTH